VEKHRTDRPQMTVKGFVPPTHFSGQTRVCKRSCLSWQRGASERLTRILGLVAGAKFVCPLFPSRLCGRHR